MLSPWILVFAAAAQGAGEPVSGWRGNQTGLWPEASPPLHWSRVPKGALENARQSAFPLKDAPLDQSPLLMKGLTRLWKVLGPFEPASSDIAKDDQPGEGDWSPERSPEGRVWESLQAPEDDVQVFGTAELPWLEVGKAIKAKHRQVAFAHAYLHSQRGGPAQIVVDHACGLKVWINGKEAYRSKESRVGLGLYPAVSRHELSHSISGSPKFPITLQSGWNRILLKLTAGSAENAAAEMKCTLRLLDPPNVAYETKNIAWMKRLPGRSTSTPLLVGDRLFLIAEPDELLCLDKKDGSLLWSAFVNPYAALGADEKAKNAGLAEAVDPLIAKLRSESDSKERARLRGRIQQGLKEADSKRFVPPLSGHFESHFGIVGFTMPTPVSDGKQVYVWNGMGVAACFDVDGTRRWMTQIKTEELNYGSSPALADGVLAVFLNGLIGLDAATGAVLWKQPKVKSNVASLQGAVFGGKPVVVTQRGDVIEPKTGAILFRPRDSIGSGDIGWAPSTILGQMMVQPRYGVLELQMYDFSQVSGKVWEPKQLKTISMPESVSRGAKGKWIDRWTAGSPLVWQGLAYQVDIYQNLYVSDLETGKLLDRRPLDLDGYTHYNAVAVAASPTLVGKHIFISDNQGNTVILEPGREFKQVAKNRIATQEDRARPISPQETGFYAPPIPDGRRLYLRGEASIYCIEKR